MLEFARSIKSDKKYNSITVVPARGSMGLDVETQSNNVVAEVSKNIHSNYKLLNVPDQLCEESIKMLTQEPEIKSTLELIDNSDLILFVLNNNEELTNEELTMLDKYNNEKLLVFVNKMDLEKKLVLPNTIKDVIYGNTIDLDGLNTLKEAISNKLNLGSIVNKDMSYLCNLREIDLVNKAEETLKNAQNNLEAGYSVDIIEIDLKAAWNYLGEIMGDSYEGELVDKIFSNFCLGK